MFGWSYDACPGTGRLVVARRVCNRSAVRSRTLVAARHDGRCRRGPASGIRSRKGISRRIERRHGIERRWLRLQLKHRRYAGEQLTAARAQLVCDNVTQKRLLRRRSSHGMSGRELNLTTGVRP